MRRNLLLSVCFLMASVLFAGPVTKQQAQEMAAQFLAGKSITHRAASASQMHIKVVMNAVDEAGQPYLYAVQPDNQRGFVIVSGDDRFRDVLGYSESGTFDNANMPDNMRAWLQGYVDEMKHLKAIGYQPSASAAHRTSGVKKAISPLIQTHWDQDDPYNQKCPEFFTYGKSVTGCVATAMAQIMYYYKYPETVLADINGYNCARNWTNQGQIHVNGISAGTSLEWNNMLPDYSGSYSNDQADAVATLMQVCGASVQMDYANSASGGSSASNANALTALITYFGYNRNARYLSRSDYSYSEWIDILYKEVSEGRPVLYGGQSTTGGHAFVVDGYDEEDYFHVNWGWSGKSDGFYAVSLMNPAEQGIGGSATNSAYAMRQEMAIGIQKTTGESIVTKLTISSIGLSEGNASEGSIPLYNNSYALVPNIVIKNYTGLSRTFDYGIRITKDGESFTRDFEWATKAEIANTASINTYKTFMLLPSDGFTAGTYKVVCISKESSASEWQVDDGSEYKYITFTIGGNTLNATAVSVTPVVNLALVGTPTFSSENAVVGKPYTITLQIKNSGTKDYHGDIVMTQTGSSNVLAGVNCDINAGETKDIVLTYIATAAGSKGVTISAVETNTVLYSGSITAENFSGPVVNVTVDNMSLNNSGPFVYGNCMKIQFDVTNNASEAYVNGVAAQLCMVTKKEGNQYWYTNIQTKQNNDQIPAGQKNTYQFEFRDLTYGAEYLMLYGYYNNAGVFVKTNTGYKQISHGIVTIDKDGNITGIAPTASYEAPANASVVDLRGQIVVTSVTPSSNPNCIYVLDEEASIPSGLTQNIVKGSNATNIVLQDNENGFVSPVDFTATKMTYTRTFDKFYDNGENWTTIVLPFAVSKVTNTSDVLPWDEANRKFWLMEFSGESGSTVNFTTAPTPLEANVPYIIALPGADQGSLSLVGKNTLTFEGDNVSVKANAKSAVTVSKYKFVGTMTNTGSLHNIYALNDDGDKFQKGTASVTPFRAYFAGTSAAATATSLGIGFGGNTTGIAELKTLRKVKDNNFYNLNGQRVSQPKKGLYIVNGKKVVIK